MNQESLFEAFVWRFGLPGLAFALVAFVFWIVIRSWLLKRIESGVEAKFDQRLRDHQHQLDKQLAEHQQAFERDRESLRASLEKSVVDYRIYAERRHDAIVKMFADFLSAEREILDDGHLVILRIPVETLPTETVERTLDEMEASSFERKHILELIEIGQPAAANEAVRAMSDIARRRQLVRASKIVADAHNAATLYLPDDVNRAAADVVAAQMAAVDAGLAAAPRSIASVDLKPLRSSIRAKMEVLLECARRELAGSTRNGGRLGSEA